MKGNPRSGRTLAVLFAINALNFLDRQVLFAVAEPIRREFGLSDASLGALGTAFIVVYAIAGLPLGRLADRSSRRLLLGAATLAWSLITLASGWARGFWDLALLRLGVGIGEAVCAPAATSLIGDLVPPRRRARAMAVFMLGLPAGISLGYLMGGLVAESWGWRAAFWFTGAPGLLAAAAALYIREPVRRGPNPALSSAKAALIGFSDIRGILAIPTMRWIIVTGALHNLVMYAFSSFLSPFLMRAHGMSVRGAGSLSTVAYGMAGGIGLACGGFLGDAAKKHRDDGRMWLAAVAVGLASPLLAWGLMQESGHTYRFGTCTALFCALMYVYYANVYATIQDVVDAERRGTAMAVYFFAMYVLGAALGPMGAGFLSDHFARQAATAAGIGWFTPESLEPFRAAGLRGALATLPVIGLLLAATLATGARACARDLNRKLGQIGDTVSGRFDQ